MFKTIITESKKKILVQSLKILMYFLFVIHTNFFN